MSVIDEINGYRDPNKVRAEKEMEAQEKANGPFANVISTALQMGQQRLQAHETGLYVGNEQRRVEKANEGRDDISSIRQEAEKVGEKVRDMERDPELKKKADMLMGKAEEMQALEGGEKPLQLE